MWENVETIVVLCDTYQDASDAFDCFVDYMEYLEPWEIRKAFGYCNCIELEEDLRYLFVYHKCVDLFLDKPGYEIISCEEFFETFNDLYEEYFAS